MFSIFKKIGWYIKENWVKYFFAILFLNIASVISVLAPKILEYGIDEIVNKTLTEQILLKLIVYFVIIIVGGYVSGYLWSYILFERPIDWSIRFVKISFAIY